MPKLMPAPIAVAWAAYQAEPHPFLKLHRLLDAYEALLKYVTVLAIQNFYHAGLAESFSEVDRLVRDRLVRPHLGDWAGFLHQVLACFAEQEDKLFCPSLFTFHFRCFGSTPTLQAHFTDQGAAGRLLGLRNLLAHDATLPNEEATAKLQEHVPDLRTLPEKAAFLSGFPLYRVEAQAEGGVFQVQPLMGANYREASPASLSLASLPPGHLVCLQRPKRYQEVVHSGICVHIPGYPHRHLRHSEAF